MDTIFLQNLSTGLIITLIGMVSVLIFLTIMIYAIDITKRIIEYINKFFPEPIEEVANKKKKKQEKTEDEVAVAVLLASLQKGK